MIGNAREGKINPIVPSKCGLSTTPKTLFSPTTWDKPLRSPVNPAPEIGPFSRNPGRISEVSHDRPHS
uniref:Uncharacterized protein n=1 Tax=Bursaphelenchus xylophilus TaxID=6326 RepID=A0A1I7SU42_BURXY